jgi:hypothetical protein
MKKGKHIQQYVRSQDRRDTHRYCYHVSSQMTFLLSGFNQMDYVEQGLP